MALGSLSKIKFSLRDLASSTVRSAIGERIFSTAIDQPEQNDTRNAFERILDGARALWTGATRLVGFVWRAVSAVVNTVGGFTGLLDTIQEGVYTLWYFDWNQSDAELKQQINGNNAAIASLLGRFAGSGVFRLVTIGVATGVALKYPVVAGRIAKELAEDSSSQLRGEFIGMLQGLKQLQIENALLRSVLFFRDRRLFGMAPVTANDKPSDTFADRVDRQIQRIPNQMIRNFVQGYLEGTEDALWDTGYIIAMTLDDIVAGQQFAQKQALGPERIVKLTPDPTQPEEVVVFAGPQALVEQNIDTALAEHQLINNRDVGQIIGFPEESNPRAERLTRSLIVTFKEKAAPPWMVDGRRAKDIQYTISDLRRGLTWQEIKAATRRYTWGKFRATALLDNRRQMAIYGVSPDEAESQLRSLLTLSTARISTLSIGEEKIRDPLYVKRPTLMYPAYATLILSPAQRGLTTPESRPTRKHVRIELWHQEEPDDLPDLETGLIR